MAIRKKGVQTQQDYKKYERDFTYRPEFSSKKGPDKESKKSVAQGKGDLDREKALKGVKEEHLKLLKENLGLDLRSSEVPVDVVYDIVKGRLTKKPVDIVVTPLAYDSGKKSRIEMPALSVSTSIRVQFPKEGGLFVDSVPARPFVEKASGNEKKDAKAEEVSEAEGSKKPAPVFSEAQLQALEGIGIQRDRVFSGFDHLSGETKRAIAEGETFFVDGAVRTSFGMLNVTGYASLETDGEGKVTASFESMKPEERKENLLLDVLDARVRGNLELDFYERDSAGKIVYEKGDVKVPKLNEAGRNLVEFGASLGPVAGYSHKRVFDRKSGGMTDKVEKAWYFVTAVNGNLYPTKMLNVPNKKEDGTVVSVRDRKGVEHIQTHPEVSARFDAEGRVFVDGQDALKFKTDRDRSDYLLGRGGLVEGAVIGTGKQKKVYDGFVFPDNRRGGFATVFSPETTKTLVERRTKEEKKEQKKAAVTRRKKQNYSLGI